jgi:sugar (pentulose or hexulose) kinase
MEKRYILGIDSGTSAVKAVLLDLKGAEVAVATETTPVETPHEGWSEFDLHQDWESVASAIRRLLRETKLDAGEILAIGVTGKGWGCCYLDGQNEPVRKGILWNDARSGPYIEAWAKSGVLAEVFRISGNYSYTGDCGPITRWIVDNEPETVRRAASVIFPPAWLVYQLTGKLKADHGDASSLFDARRRVFSDPLFDLLGIRSMRDRFPEPTSCTDIAGEVTPHAAEATGLKAGTPVVLGEVDVSSCATGVGVIENGDVCIILGTAHIVSVCLDTPIFEPEVGLFMTYIAGKYLKLPSPAIATPNVDWYLKTFGHADRAEAASANQDVFQYLEGKLSAIAPGADGILYHPYLSPMGERCPFSKLTAKANLFGLAADHDRHHILRAIYEGVAFSALDCLTACQTPIGKVMLSGGGARSGVWGQIEADILGTAVSVPAGTEFGARGAALTALVAMGVYPDHQAAIRACTAQERVYEPSPRNRSIYQELFQLYRDITRHLWSDWDRRAEILARAAAGDAAQTRSRAS